MRHAIPARLLVAAMIACLHAGCGSEDPTPGPQTADEKATAALVGTWHLRIDEGLMRAYQQEHESHGTRVGAQSALGSIYRPRVVGFTLRSDGTFAWRGRLKFQSFQETLGPTSKDKPLRGTGWWRYCHPGLAALVFDYTMPSLEGTEPRWSVHTELVDLQGEALTILGDLGITHTYERGK